MQSVFWDHTVQFMDIILQHIKKRENKKKTSCINQKQSFCRSSFLCSFPCFLHILQYIKFANCIVFIFLTLTTIYCYLFSHDCLNCYIIIAVVFILIKLLELKMISRILFFQNSILEIINDFWIVSKLKAIDWNLLIEFVEIIVILGHIHLGFYLLFSILCFAFFVVCILAYSIPTIVKFIFLYIRILCI